MERVGAQSANVARCWIFRFVARTRFHRAQSTWTIAPRCAWTFHLDPPSWGVDVKETVAYTSWNFHINVNAVPFLRVKV